MLYQRGTVENCIVNVDVVSIGIGTTYGGAAGILYENGNVEKSANLGNITARISNAGGIIGYHHGSGIGIIEYCYNMGTITGATAGGIAGLRNGSSRIIRSCYNVGSIIGNEGLSGAILGYGLNDNYVYCNFYLEDCIENNNEFGESKSAEFMHSQAFVDLLNYNNQVDVWTMDAENTNDGYPIIGDTHFGVSENFFTNTDLVIVYPNPATDYINIVGDVASYEVYDIVGKCVCRDARSCVSTISVSDFQSGIYIMKFVMRNGSVVTKKIVKK